MADAQPWYTLTTDPDKIISWTTAFNLGLWSAGGAYVGSMFNLPSPYGEINGGGPGATLGGLGYILALVYNKGTGLPGELGDELNIIFLTVLGGKEAGEHTKPPPPEEAEQKANSSPAGQAFYARYGLKFTDALRRYYTDHPEDKQLEHFYEWSNHTYLPINLQNTAHYEGTEGQNNRISEAIKKLVERYKLLTIKPAPTHTAGPGGPVRPKRQLEEPTPFVSDHTGLLLVTGGTILGETMNRPVVGALVGAVAAVVYKNNKKRRLQ